MANCPTMCAAVIAVPHNKICYKKTSARMVLLNTNGESQQSHQSLHFQRKTFDDAKIGVKGLVDAGIAALPRIFVHPPHHVKNIANSHHQLQLPVIDLDGIDDDSGKHREILDKILDASQTWGFFQVVNHGISMSTLKEALDGVRRFHEQAVELKKPYYNRDFSRKFSYYSNYDLYSAPVACWRDTIHYIATPGTPSPEELPQTCREILVDYSKEAMDVGITLFKLISKALGLDPNCLVDMDCAQNLSLVGQYYPACPEPNRTLGSKAHTDYTFLTILLQDDFGGLQVLYDGQHWVDVAPLRGSLIVNIGDLLQLISNDKLKSVKHRVLANHRGPRVSLVAFFGRDTSGVNSRVYGPISQLISDKHPSKYRATTIKEYTTIKEHTTYVRHKGSDGTINFLEGFEI